MIIRSMMPADAEAVHVIHSVCLERTLLGRYTREQITAWTTGRTPQGYLRASEAGERFFIAEEEGVAVGFASWQDDQLLAVFVHPDFQARGIGSALVSACFEDAARTDATISIVRSVLGAEAFYSRHGFLIVGPGSTSKHGVIIQDTQMRRATAKRCRTAPLGNRLAAHTGSHPKAMITVWPLRGSLDHRVWLLFIKILRKLPTGRQPSPQTPGRLKSSLYRRQCILFPKRGSLRQCPFRNILSS